MEPGLRWPLTCGITAVGAWPRKWTFRTLQAGESQLKEHAKGISVVVMFTTLPPFKFPTRECAPCGTLRLFWPLPGTHVPSPNVRAGSSVSPGAPSPSLGPLCPFGCIQGGWVGVKRECPCDLACRAMGHPWSCVVGHSLVTRPGEAMDCEAGALVCGPPESALFLLQVKGAGWLSPHQR